MITKAQAKKLLKLTLEYRDAAMAYSWKGAGSDQNNIDVTQTYRSKELKLTSFIDSITEEQ